MALVLAVTGLAVLGVCSARADDVLVDASVEPVSLAGGEGWTVWAVVRPDGSLTLRGSAPGDQPRDLPVAPFRAVRSVDVGRGPDGAPTAVYDACRRRCRIYFLRLGGGDERAMRLAATPRGCQYWSPVIDRHLFIVRTGTRNPAPRRCREGIYERLVAGRLVRRQAGRGIYFDVSHRRLAFQHRRRDGVIEIVARRLGRRGRSVLEHNPTENYDGGVAYDLAWQGGRLWLGRYATWGESGEATADARLLTVGRRVTCRRDSRTFAGMYTGGAPVPTDWAFPGGAIYYAIEGTAGNELRRRSDPPPRFLACP